MKKNVKMMSKIGGLGLASALFLGASNATAEQFDATVQIQNALAIGTPTALDFGTLFASSANASASAGIILAPNGDTSEDTLIVASGASSADAPPFLSLVDGTPATGIVSTDADFTLIMPSIEKADLAPSNVWTPGPVVLRASGDTSAAAFYLTDFEIGTAAGTTLIQTGGSGTPTATESATTPGTYSVNPGFGAESITFNLGATIWTDGAGGTAVSYEAATYAGTFEVIAEFQ